MLKSFETQKNGEKDAPLVRWTEGRDARLDVHLAQTPPLPARSHPSPGFKRPWSRPQCITNALRARGLNTSTSLPDDVLNFVRRHPLMARQVQPLRRQPVLFSRTTDYTHMAVHTTQGVDERMYHVLYVGTGRIRLYFVNMFLVGTERLSLSLCIIRVCMCT